MDDYLPLAYLNAWEYCPRRFYLEYQLGEMADNEHILMGRYLHQNVDRDGRAQIGNTIAYRHQWVWSDRLSVKGIIDTVEQRDDCLVPVEYKKGRMAKHLNDHFQLCAAGLCLEERLGCTIAYGEIFYHANRHRQRVEFTSHLRQATELAIEAAKQTALGEMPFPNVPAKKCRDCSLKSICLPKELKKLSREVM
jgi:CRISPR-associated exonuclease Cas4